MKQNWKQGLLSIWKGWGWSLLVALSIATSFKSAIADWNVVPTGSMLPTIVQGDRILVNKLAYDLKVPYTTRHIAKWGDPQRGDIVVFYSPEDSKRLVKRVVGLPGDVIGMLDNILFINGHTQVYEAISDHLEQRSTNQSAFVEELSGRKHRVWVDSLGSLSGTFGPIVVPESNYFMLGDNRDKSADSRYFGFVPRHRIIGQATAVVASFDIHNHYRPRWERFFTKLP